MRATSVSNQANVVISLVRWLTFILAIALSAAIGLYVLYAANLSTVYFHIIYWTLLTALSVHIVASIELQKTRMALLTTIVVMLALRLMPILTVSYPVIYGPDVKYELQIVHGILSSGGVPVGQYNPIGEAYVYSFYPGLEVLFTSLTLISSINATVLMKYTGTFMGIATVLLFFSVYRRIWSHTPSILSTSLAALSPWFIWFDTFTVHETLAFALVGMVVLSLASRGRAWKIISLLGLLAIVVTHLTTTYLFSFVLVEMYVLSRSTRIGSARRPLSDLSSRVIFLFALLILGWACLAALSSLQSEVSPYFQMILHILITPEVSGVPIPLRITGLKPLWVVVAYTLGLLTFGVISLGKSAFGLVRRQLSPEVIFATSGLVVFSIFLAPYLLGLSYGLDLYGRALTYLYFFSSPIVGMFVVKLYRQQWLSRPKLNKVGGYCLVVLLLLIMFLPAVYYGASPGIYDRNAPVLHSDDPRLSYDEWQAVANFAIIRVDARIVWGVHLAWEFVGGLGGKDVLPLFLGQTELATFVHERHGELFFLRTSMVHLPDYSAVTIGDMRAMYATSAVLYSSGDVIIVVSP